MAGAKKPGRVAVVPGSWQEEILGAVEGAKVAPAVPAAATRAAPVATAAAAPVFTPDAALFRRILRAREPLVLAEVEAGVAEAAKGEAALVAWLARPIARDDGEDVDPLEALSAALSAATSHANRLPPLHRGAATMIGKVAEIAARLEKVTMARPRPPTPDEVEERIAARRDDAIKKISEYTGDARAKLDADRAELVAWARSNLGPMIASELERRLGLMLGEEAAT